jgi:DNA primase
MRTYLQSILPSLTAGSTYRGYCPSCGSASTFTAHLSGAEYVLYNCYKASCTDDWGNPTAGRYNIKLSTEEKTAYLKKKALREEQEALEFSVPDYWIDGVGNELCVEYMRKTHMMSVYEKQGFRPMYDPAERRFVFPIKDGTEVVGGIGRSLVGGYPKTMNYNKHYTKPFTCGKGNVVLLVEDCASAVAAARSPNVTGMALLGTNIRNDFILSMTKFKWVGIALDPDAYSKSLRLKVRVAPYLRDVRVLKLPNDIKDLSDEEYNSFLYKNNLSS